MAKQACTYFILTKQKFSFLKASLYFSHSNTNTNTEAYMKILAALFLVLSVSATAQADYFACRISQGGSVLASVEAEYRVYTASVEAEGFVCEGKINGRATTVKLTNKNTSEVAESTEQGPSASTYLSTLPRHNEFDMICSCGMQ